MLVACVLLSLTALVLPPEPRSTVASALRGTVVVPLAALQERAEVSRRAVLAYDAAVRVADSVRLEASQADVVAAENERLRRLLGLGAALKWGFVPAEALHGRGLGDDYTMTLTVGRDEGVEPFSAVVAPDGLVGMIERVDARSSVAIVGPHPDFRVSAMSADGSSFGIVYPHLGSGATRFLLELRGVAFRSALRPGTLIVSAGLGGVYPRGIPVGTVLSEINTAEGWARSYLLRPAVRPADATSVMVLQPRRSKEGVATAWQTAVDSALRLVVSAGDSLARRRADSLATAERKRLDSLQALQPRPDSAVPPEGRP
ncbi:MAG: rod shape-determining protein MreC [Gemmatimonadetes bacterium]|nr:rod shape-determining protein MreC [Gemmatimonadota bacterium]